MISFERAKEMASNKLKEIESRSFSKLAFLEQRTREFEYGWVFFYQSEEFIRTGKSETRVGGNAPLIVDKYKGDVHITGTAKRIEEYIDEYCKKQKK